MLEKTYLSSDDSLLLRNIIKSEKGNSFIEIGVGYGSNLSSVSSKFRLAVGTDIRKTEAFGIRNANFELVIADRASCFRSSVFDLVAINPPYLPSEEIQDLATDGGEGGFEVPRFFLEDAFRVMKPKGRVMVVLSSETNLEQFENYCATNSINFTCLARKRIFLETLYAFELRKGKIERKLNILTNKSGIESEEDNRRVT